MITFVRKSARALRSKSPHIDILHHALAWKLLTDLHDQHYFPSHITYTQLFPDIVKFSNTTKKVIFIKLTCPCEENMEKWHDEKLRK